MSLADELGIRTSWLVWHLEAESDRSFKGKEQDANVCFFLSLTVS